MYYKVFQSNERPFVRPTSGQDQVTTTHSFLNRSNHANFSPQNQFFNDLAPEPARKLIKLARDKGVTNTEFIRYIIVQFLEGEEQAGKTLLERPFLDALKTATNRICSLLAKIAIDVSLIAHYLREIGADDDREVYDRCYLLAIERVKKRVTPDETEIITRLVP